MALATAAGGLARSAEHFAAFSFVDRITDYVPGRSARGVFAIPATLERFASCLVAEATGQLAAWVAMAHIAFRGRPVAALANETRFLADPAPGQTLELAVDIEHCDDDAVAYRGRAQAAGVPLLELVDCLGPMLPCADFDAPEALAERFELLCGAGALPGRFHGIVPLHFVSGETVPGERATATLFVPDKAPFFADHFPRRPVFPATLLLDQQIRLALDLAATATHWPANARLMPSRMTHVKVRSFMPPGAVLELAAEMTPASAESGPAPPTAAPAIAAHARTSAAATIRLGARMDGKQVASARLEVVAQGAA
jgi:3-hydroxymyristoyl/3-hydroxydecanoyl-(acyl carrier protein) dehydratase